MLNVSLDEISVNDLIVLMGEQEIDCDCYEGCLQDNLIYYGTENVVIDGMSRKFLIFRERYLNSWSSDLELIMTDSYEEVEKYREMFEN